MALGDAQINIGRGYVREFQWLHYADWTATTPIIFTILGLLAGVSWTEIVFYIGCGACRRGAGVGCALQGRAKRARSLSTSVSL
jgi:bacteriorhodopsin